MATPVFFRKKCCRLDGSLLFPHPDLQAIKMMMTLTSELKTLKIPLFLPTLEMTNHKKYKKFAA